MNSNGYNGWANRSTWVVGLHFGDDTEYIAEMAQQVHGDVDDMADAIKDMVLDYIDENLGDNLFIRDLMTTSEIDWRELAENWLSDYQEEEEEVEE
jgi:hypothetical protein